MADSWAAGFQSAPEQVKAPGLLPGAAWERGLYAAEPEWAVAVPAAPLPGAEPAELWAQGYKAVRDRFGPGPEAA